MTSNASPPEKATSGKVAALKKPTARPLGRKAFVAISAVEGLKLSRAGRERVSSKEPLETRRAEVIRAYSRPKGK